MFVRLIFCFFVSGLFMSGRFPQSFMTRDHITDCSEVKFETVQTRVPYQDIQRLVFGRINHLEIRDDQFPTLKVLKIEKSGLS